MGRERWADRDFDARRCEPVGRVSFTGRGAAWAGRFGSPREACRDRSIQPVSWARSDVDALLFFHVPGPLEREPGIRLGFSDRSLALLLSFPALRSALFLPSDRGPETGRLAGWRGSRIKKASALLVLRKSSRLSSSTPPPSDSLGRSASHPPPAPPFPREAPLIEASSPDWEPFGALFEGLRGLLSLRRVDPAEGVVVHRFTAELAADAPANAMPIKNRHHRQKSGVESHGFEAARQHGFPPPPPFRRPVVPGGLFGRSGPPALGHPVRGPSGARCAA